VSGNGGPSELTSKLVDHFLKRYIPDIPSYVKDTTHFLRIIDNTPKLPPGSLLVTLDVTSLYTNIPQDDGIRAVARLLMSRRPNTALPANRSLIELLTLALKRNNFAFNDQHYLQIQGTAMGNPFAPSFANIYMADFEKNHIYTYTHQPHIWLRYIDDIFMIWTHGLDLLTTFLQHINNVHPTLSFTSQHSLNRVHFLDTTVCLDSTGTLSTTLYTKPTDSHSYLLYSSAHPRHTLNSLPFSQFLRVRRICTYLHDYDRHAAILYQHFIQRNYPSHVVQQALSKARRLDRSQLLTKTKDTKSVQGEQDRSFLITTHHPQTDKMLKNILENNRPLLFASRTTTPLAQTEFVCGHRRNPNLRDILVRAKFSYQSPALTSQSTTTPTPHNPCYTKQCRYCSVLDHTGRIACTSTGRTYTAMLNCTCKSNNLIYCITCSFCHKQYVGQTKRRLMDRFQSHFYNISRNHRDDPIGFHFNLPGHTGTNNIQIHILQYILQAPNSYSGALTRDTTEKKWIHRLHTVAPLGLNSMD